MDDGLRTALSSISNELAVRNLRYALIGGLAASLRGRIRATDDVDLIILCSLDEALALGRFCGLGTAVLMLRSNRHSALGFKTNVTSKLRSCPDRGVSLFRPSHDFFGFNRFPTGAGLVAANAKISCNNLDRLDNSEPANRIEW